MNKFCFLILFLTLFACNRKNIFSFSLETAECTLYSLESLKQNKISVFVFLSPDCPLSKSYTLSVKEFQNKFSGNEIQFLAVFPGTHYTGSEIKNFSEEYSLHIPLLLDPEKILVNFFGAEITPEVFVVNQTGETVYSGSIDNGYADLGKKREMITEHYLEDALNAVLSGKEIQIEKTKAVGCYIE